MPDKKAASLLGLAQKAGKVVSGEFACSNAIRDGSAKLLILAVDASGNTSKKFTDNCSYYKVPLCRCFTKSELGHFLGKEERAVAVVTDEGFAGSLKKKLLNEDI